MNNDPYLNGYWGGKLKTMTEQACQLGIPSIQLEITNKMRTLLFTDSKFSSAFLAAILNAYKDVVVPYWAARQMPILADPISLGTNLQLLNSECREKNQLRAVVEKKLSQYEEWEKKQSATEKII